MASHVEGEWQFSDVGGGATKIVWTYKIIPKNFICRELIKTMVIGNVRGYLTNALSIITDDFNSGAYKSFK